MKKITLILFLGLFCVFTSQLKAQNYAQNLTDHFATLVENEDLLSNDIHWLVSDENVSRTSNIQHIYFTQSINEVEIFGTQSSIHILNGETISSNNKFIRKSSDKVIGSSSPSINAAQAVTAAANQLDYVITEAITVLEASQGNDQKTILSNGGVSLSDIPAKLVYHITKKNRLVLAWDISIQEINQQDWWSMRVDANTGEILNKLNWMVSCSFDHDHNIHESLNYNTNLFDIPNYNETAEEIGGCTSCYEVIAMPLESPYYGARSIESGVEDAVASPFGWHDTDGSVGAEFTVTRGNNVDAYEDGDNQGYQPDGGTNLNFTGYPFDEVYSNANQYEDAAITNLFYWNNIIHDVMYTYGFDEAGGNFQENNYGNGGLGSDYVNAEAQDGSGTCNANFGTPADGSNPTMQMYVCNDKDGDFDNLVIVHEYGHGISNRLTGGPASSGCLGNSEQMGEGWSDYFGVMLTIEPGDLGTDERGVGTYLFGEGAGGDGIRPFPYSTDMGVNPQTYNNIKTAAIPHGVGSVWATMLWEVSWALIDEHGWDADIYNFAGDINLDAGNVIAMAIVTEGMKLQPCSPGFVDGRDAILAADQAIYGGANECIIWDAFAKRGLGFSADQGSSGSVTDGTEAFDSPVPALNTSDDVLCVSQGIQVFGGGTPIGGEYSGPGVTDNGDGLTYDFDPATAGIGIHTIDYDVVSACATGAASDDIEVITDVPEILCQDITLELDANGEATLTIHDVVTNLEPGVASFTEDFDTGLPADWSTVVNTGNCDWINSANPPIGDSFGSPAMLFDDDDCGNGAPASNVSLLSAVYDVADNTIITLNYEVGFQEFGAGQTFVTEVWDGNAWQQVALINENTSIQTVSIDVSAYANADFQVRWTYDDNNGEWGWYAGVDSFQLDYDVPGAPADNCGNTTTATLSQELFTCDDLDATTTVTITFDDGNGNTNTCTAEVTVTDPLLACELSTESYELEKNIVLYPNPTNGQLTLVNNGSVALVNAMVTDVNGRIIKSFDLSNSNVETSMSIENLASGMYFIKILSKESSIIRQIIKQ